MQQSSPIQVSTTIIAGDALALDVAECLHSRNVVTVAAQACAGRSGAYVVQVATEDGRPVASFHGLARTTGGTIIPTRENDHG